MQSAPEMPKETSDGTLAVVSAVGAVFDNDSVTIDDKLYSGLLRYRQKWGGPLAVLTPVSNETMPYSTRYVVDDLPFRIMPFDPNSPAVGAILANARCILASADDHRQLFLWQATSQPIIFIIEYTLRTRLQQIKVARTTIGQKLKTTIWTLLQERRLRRALRHAAGVQCNGTPADTAYRCLNSNTLRYFDTRMTDAMMIDEQTLSNKTQRLANGDVLRLAYSGRLETIKGAHHLVEIANRLRTRDVPFTLDIYGTGSLFAEMQRAITEARLEQCIQLHGAADFKSELVPRLCGSIDLFLCCHLQDDPSCTYLETLACGVPIAGYRNLAFDGVLGLGDVGAVTRARTPDDMVQLVEELNAGRPRLASMMRAASQVGRANSFEKVFDERISHMNATSERATQPH